MSEDRSVERVVVAMSGGVDSSVAAALLVERGYQVTGATFRPWIGGGPEIAGTGHARIAEAVARAEAIAAHLEIPFHVIDVASEFATHVVDYFIAEYAAGRTPNPCVPCNRHVKFGLLLKRAEALGASLLATGHYARIRRQEDQVQLLRGADRLKDQSYFLHALTQRQLARALFPLGDFTKEDVRAMARRRNLPVAEQPESQDICFLAGDDYRRFLAREAPHLLRPGPIRDSSGRVIGQHQGVAGYTIGQRKGLGIAAPRPLYVLAIDPGDCALIVGSVEELGRDKCLVREMHIISEQAPQTAFQALAQIRYRARPVEVTVAPLPNRQAHVQFTAPQRDITPGQFLVAYDGDVVLGGGTIWAPS